MSHGGDIDRMLQNFMDECPAHASINTQEIDRLVAGHPELEQELNKLRLIIQAGQCADRSSSTQSPVVSTSVLPSAPPLVPDYELLRLISCGGFGQVWLGRNRHTRRYQAVKWIPCFREVELEGICIYQQRIAGHPHLVPIEHVGNTGESLYYTMPLADDANGSAGVRDPNDYEPLTLHLHLKRHGPLAVDEVIGIGKKLLEALEHLHSAGLVHHDVKPTNVFRIQGNWHLGDMGLIAAEEQRVASRGTRAFWPPEGPRDRSADLFALGKIMYLAVSGARLEQFADFTQSRLPPPGQDRRLPALKQIILRACSEDPGKRFPTAQAMRRALERLSSRVRRQRIAALAVGIMVTGLILLKSLGFFHRTPPPDTPFSGELTVWAEIPGGHGTLWRKIDDPGILPLRAGTRVRLHASLTQSAFIYLLWLDSQGQVLPLYPWNEDQIVNRLSTPPPGVNPTTEIRSPVQESRGWLLDNHGGLETVLLLARREPFPDPLSWQELIGQWKPPPLPQGQDPAVRGPDQKPAVPLFHFDASRGIAPEAGGADADFLQLIDRLRTHFELIRAVRFAHEEKQEPLGNGQLPKREPENRRWKIRDGELAARHQEFLKNLSATAQQGLDRAQALQKQLDQLFQQSRYFEALPLAKQIVALRQDSGETGFPIYADSLDTLGRVFQQLGDYPQALEYLEQARSRRRDLLNEDHPAFAVSLNHLARLYHTLQDRPRAQKLLEQARGIQRDLPAEFLLEYAVTLYNLALIHQAHLDFSQADALLREVHEIRVRRLPDSHPDFIQVLQAMAANAHAQSNTPRALALYEQTRDLIERHHPNNHALHAACLNNLAMLRKKMGDSGDALALLEKARALWKQALPEDHPSYAVNLYNLAGLYRDLRREAEAAGLLEESLQARQRILSKTISALSERQRFVFLQELKRALDLYLSVAPAAAVPTRRIYELVLSWKGILADSHAEERLAGSSPDLQPDFKNLRQVQGELAHLVYAPSPPSADWKKRLDDLETRKEALEISLANTSAAFRQVLEMRHATCEDILQALPSRTAFVDFLEYYHSPAASEGLSKKPAEKHLLAFALRRDRPPVMVLLGPSAPIGAAVQKWRQHLAAPETFIDVPKQFLWVPLRESLNEIDTLLVAPDGPVQGFPLAALPGSKPGAYLIEEYALGYVISGRQLLAIQRQKNRSAAEGLLAIGDLDYGAPPIFRGSQASQPSRPSWCALPGTRVEVEAIAETYRRAFPSSRSPTTVTGGDLNAEQFKGWFHGASPWRYVHLATHAFCTPAAPPGTISGLSSSAMKKPEDAWFMDRNPLLRSGLVLGQANETAARAILTAEEVASLDMRGTELVVLSACKTGLGTVAPGEGVLGLQQAFQAAGAGSLVATLWDAHDAATSLLMEEFYANLWKERMPKLASLRAAQITILRHPERVHDRARLLLEVLSKQGVTRELLAARGILPDAAPASADAPPTSAGPPAWWAGFILSGDWR